MTNDDDNDADEEADNGGDISMDGEPNKPKTPIKKKRTRKQISTITKNKETINGRLDMMQTPDALFYKLNSIMGETSSSNKLILNMLTTRTSDLSVAMGQMFWDNRQYEPIQFNDGDNYDGDEITYSDLPTKPHIPPQSTLRQQMVGYAIINTPIDNDVEYVSNKIDSTISCHGRLVALFI